MTAPTDHTTLIADALGADTLSRLLGMKLLSANHGTVEVTAMPTADHCNAGGMVQGGYLSAFADWATGIAAVSANGATAMAPHASLSVQYIAIAKPNELLACSASCTRTGRRAATTEATITAGDRLIARALATHTLLTPIDR